MERRHGARDLRDTDGTATSYAALGSSTPRQREGEVCAVVGRAIETWSRLVIA